MFGLESSTHSWKSKGEDFSLKLGKQSKIPTYSQAVSWNVFHYRL